GLAPLRTRWRNSEVSSPMTIDFTDRPIPDNYIEVSLDEPSDIYYADGPLYQLPSGKLHWQRSTALQYPTRVDLARIWALQQNLTVSTTEENIKERIGLTQLWLDLLTLEGFSFSNTSGSILATPLSPSTIRSRVNAALGQRDISTASDLLDGYINQLDSITRVWFADGSVRNIRDDQWVRLEEIVDIVEKDKQLILHCKAANKNVTLYVELPEIGGIRLHADKEGYFKPESLLDMDGTHSRNWYELVVGHGKMVFTKRPFRMVFLDERGAEVKAIGKGDIAFLLDGEEKPVAVDFTSQLNTDEVIYGFGERYDHFNQRGNVLTLWGVDDWLGITVGLRNQTYKPIPVFHSSKG